MNDPHVRFDLRLEPNGKMDMIAMIEGRVVSASTGYAQWTLDEMESVLVRFMEANPTKAK